MPADEAGMLQFLQHMHFCASCKRIKTEQEELIRWGVDEWTQDFMA